MEEREEAVRQHESNSSGGLVLKTSPNGLVNQE